MFLEKIRLKLISFAFILFFLSFFGTVTAQTKITGDPAVFLETLNYKVMIKPSIEYLSCGKVISASGDELSFANDTLRLVDRSDDNNIIQYKIPKYLLKQLKYNTKNTLTKVGAGYGAGVAISTLGGVLIFLKEPFGGPIIGGIIGLLVGVAVVGPIFAASNATITDFNYSFEVSQEVIDKWNLIELLKDIKSKKQQPYFAWEKKFDSRFKSNSIKENKEIALNRIELYEYKKCNHFLKYTDSSEVNILPLDNKQEKQLRFEVLKYEVLTSYLENDNSINYFSPNIYKEINSSDIGLIDDPEFFRFQSKTVFPVKYVFYHLAENEIYLLVCYSNPKKAILNVIDKKEEKKMLEVLEKKAGSK